MRTLLSQTCFQYGTTNRPSKVFLCSSSQVWVVAFSLARLLNFIPAWKPTEIFETVFSVKDTIRMSDSGLNQYSLLETIKMETFFS